MWQILQTSGKVHVASAIAVRSLLQVLYNLPLDFYNVTITKVVILPIWYKYWYSLLQYRT